jgi:activator of HSP90 ATPase
MTEKIKLSAVIPATAKEIYIAWLDSKKHSAFTGGGKAKIDPKVKGKFTAWEDYISGTNLELIPNKKIVQAWRTTEFPAKHPDSILEVILEPAAKGTKVTLVHSEIPEGQSADYKKGWKDFYLTPMKKYFSK